MRVGIVGVTFKNPDGSSRQELLEKLYDEYYTEGYEDEIGLRLVREPDNRYDSNAVAVYVDSPPEYQGQIGYLPGPRAEWIGPAMDEDRLVGAELASMGLSKTSKVGLTLLVKIRDEDDSPEDCSEEQEPEDGRHVEDQDGRVYELR